MSSTQSATTTKGTTMHAVTVTPGAPETTFKDGPYTLACTCGELVTYAGKALLSTVPAYARGNRPRQRVTRVLDEDAKQTPETQ